ncbi:hypothetical protein [Intrasporangium sp. YIM S08009]|uniref:hypothetical protein n=1 Tax=Intrasporangium zincisolvens TaxID=3080018 RepID=UPI002B057DC0|nr:hypothetical protein [Intrasporangium sp. YIM S08009]
MIDLSWTIGEEREVELTEAPRPVLSTWNYLRTAMRRRWRVWVGLTALGAVLGLAAVVLVPPGSTAKVTLLMAHPASIDGPQGIAMDVSLLNTREVSQRAVQALGIGMTPEAFRAGISAEAVTNEVLTIAVAGPDDASAAARADALVRQYLDFRTTQLRSLTSGMRAQYATRVAAAQREVTALTKQFEQLTAQGPSAQSSAFDALARRTDLNKQIADWQAASDSATLDTDAAVESTHVIDPVHADASSTKRAVVLAVASGMTVGAALGAVFVIFRALVTERLRRRQDVGVALGSPVRFSVRSTGPRRGGPGPLGRVLPIRGRWRGNDLGTLAHGLQSALEPALAVPTPTAPVPATASEATGTNGRRAGAVASEPNGSRVLAMTSARAETLVGPGPVSGPCDGVALAAIGNVRAAADVVDAAATRLRERGTAVLVVDLSKEGVLAGRAGERTGGSAMAEGDGPGGSMSVVLRPGGIPELATGPGGGTSAGLVDVHGSSWQTAWESAHTVLVLLEVDPGIDVDHLGTWVDQVVPLVSAGASTAELLSTTGDLVREAGLALPFAMMVGCDATDESLGRVRPAEDGVEAVSQP